MTGLKLFFITGLPRSRTAWLANLLTYGPSFCLHDACADGLDAQAIIQRAGDVALVNAKDFAGVSDSGLVFIAAELVDLRYDAQWVVVRRNREAAEESYRNYFAGRAYAGLPPVAAGKVAAAFDAASQALDDALALLPSQRTLVLEFEDLNHVEVCAAIWNWCVPGVPFNRARWALLDKLAINPIPEKVDATALVEQLQQGGASVRASRLVSSLAPP